ncbi:MAG TPA: heme exporter protein CcmB [Chromatiaceae bacterium]|jgi:heme exporter protein B|nr:heme exporter protein CcmB [Chromatiaceae bacterium]HIO14143.1 heme exporter protein CcmB [Chromatiales bacterium]
MVLALALNKSPWTIIVSDFNTLSALIASEVSTTWRRTSDITNPLAFYLMVVCLFPLSLGPEPALLQRIGPGVIWVATLLAGLISIERMFRDDWDDGVIDQMRLSPIPLWIPVLAKAIAHWLTSGLPAIVLSPIVALLMGINGDTLWVLMLALGLGTPIVSLVGTIGVALTVEQKSGSALQTVLILPILTPVLVFGSASVDLAANGQAISAHLSLLAAFLIFVLYSAPWAASLALRISSE